MDERIDALVLRLHEVFLRSRSSRPSHAFCVRIFKHFERFFPVKSRLCVVVFWRCLSRRSSVFAQSFQTAVVLPNRKSGKSSGSRLAGLVSVLFVSFALSFLCFFPKGQTKKRLKIDKIFLFKKSFIKNLDWSGKIRLIHVKIRPPIADIHRFTRDCIVPGRVNRGGGVHVGRFIE